MIHKQALDLLSTPLHIHLYPLPAHSNDLFSPPQLFAKLQAVKSEIQDIQDSHIKERQDLEQTQNELTRELKLK